MQRTKQIMTGLLIVALFDFSVVAFGIAQIAVEGRTGYWSPFWAVQARAIVHLLGIH